MQYGTVHRCALGDRLSLFRLSQLIATPYLQQHVVQLVQKGENQTATRGKRLRIRNRA